MATKTEYEVSESRKALVSSDAVLAEMEANGQLQPFTDYYTPDENSENYYADLLWENGDPNASFALTTLKNVIDMSKYKYIVVVGKFHTSTVASLITKIPYVVGSNACLMRIDDNYVGRVFRIESPTSMYIDDCYRSGTMDNSRCIPYRIYGTDIL